MFDLFLQKQIVEGQNKEICKIFCLSLYQGRIFLLAISPLQAKV